MPLYEYRCNRQHTTEAIRSMDCSVIACAVCESPANRLGAYRVAITAPEADTRNMTRRYIEATAEMDHAATKVEQSTGQPVQTPPFWQMAKRYAQQKVAAGEAPPVRRTE